MVAPGVIGTISDPDVFPREDTEPFVDFLSAVPTEDPANAAVLGHRPIAGFAVVDHLAKGIGSVDGYTTGSDGVAVKDPVVLDALAGVMDIEINAGTAAALGMKGADIEPQPVVPGEVQHTLAGMIDVAGDGGQGHPAGGGSGSSATSPGVSFDGVSTGNSGIIAAFDGVIVIAGVRTIPDYNHLPPLGRRYG